MKQKMDVEFNSSLFYDGHNSTSETES